MSPYEKALAHITHHPGTGSATRLVKLLLSLWNGTDCGFSVRECLEGLDHERQRIALGCVTHFAAHGEDDELVRISHLLYQRYPRTWQLGIAARDARAGGAAGEVGSGTRARDRAGGARGARGARASA